MSSEATGSTTLESIELAHGDSGSAAGLLRLRVASTTKPTASTTLVRTEIKRSSEQERGLRRPDLPSTVLERVRMGWRGDATAGSMTRCNRGCKSCRPDGVRSAGTLAR